MKILAVLSQKGGTGKSTLSVNLAVAAIQDGKQVAVIDLDPHANAKTWHDLREDKEQPTVISAQSIRLPEIVATARESGADWLIIDTPAQTESIALDASRQADLILVPCRAGVYDLSANRRTLELAQIIQKPAVVVMNAVPPVGALGGQAAQSLQQDGVEVAPCQVSQRAAFVHSTTLGLGVLEYEPEGKAAAEIQEVYTWACGRVGATTEGSQTQEKERMVAV